MMKTSKPIILSLLVATVLMACGSDQTVETDNQAVENSPVVHQTQEIPPSKTPAKRMVGDFLSQQIAQDRKGQISAVSYIMTIDLVSVPDAYQGQVEMNFNYTPKGKELTIDFTGGSVISLTVNGQELSVDYNGYFLTIPAESLQTGDNKIVVIYQHPYDQDGTGLHRFIDPEDGETYFYTYLWPYYANRLFPHFDQPNLKATYQLSVRADKNWQVVSSVKENQVVAYKGDRIWHFPPSARFSSYVFSLHAGPYQVWESQADDIPIRLMARKSLAPHVPVDEWFGYTKDGLQHFTDYFGIKYPFTKYDQILVPDFNIGAMENVAAVTFTERLIQTGPSNRFQKQRRASIILHEMAHMWFGNLVTKEWWNGLWLNESFATLMASIAVAKIPEFEDLWHDFYLSTQLRAIEADNKVSTHPIEVRVPSTNDFFAVFDAITYQKGASVLNQLSHLVGPENFRVGVSQYLKKHAWKNTELVDFISAQSSQANTDLSEWSKNWLYKAGVNHIEVEYTCEGDNINAFAVRQANQEHLPVLRKHRLQMALFDDAMEPLTVVPVTIEGEYTELSEFIGRTCPYLVYPNYQAWGYVQVQLDEVSKINAFNAISKTKDPMLRSMLWTSVFEDPSTSLEQVIIGLDAETNDRVINQVLAELSKKLNLLERQNDSRLDVLSAQLEDLLWLHLSNRTEDNNIRLIKLPAYINVVRTKAGSEKLMSLLDGSVALPDLTVSQEHRWLILQRLAVLNHSGINALIAQELQKDPSDAGRLFAIAAESAIPKREIKNKWLKQFMRHENALPLAHQRVAMRHLFPANQASVQESMLVDLIAALPDIAANRDNYYQRAYAESLFDGVCSATSITEMQQAADLEKLGTTLYRYLSENIQKAQACVKDQNQQ